MSIEFISPGKKIWITGHELRLQGNFELAIDLFLDILTSPASQDQILKIDTLNELVLCNRALHIYEMAAEYSLEALELSNEADYKLGKANALLNLGALAHLSFSLKEAKDFFRRALTVFEGDLNDKLGIAKVLLHLGLVSRDEGMIEKAEGDLYTAYKLIEKEYTDPEYRYVLVRILNHLGNTKLLNLNFLDGITLFKDSLAFSENTKDYYKKPMILRHLALCHFILDHNREFTNLIKESIEISEALKQTNELYLSKMYYLTFEFQNKHYTEINKLLIDLDKLSRIKYSPLNFMIYFITGLVKNEMLDETIKDTLLSMENYYRNNSHKIKQSQNLILLEIESVRVLTDQIVAEQGGYSFGLSRKLEKLIRVARGHKEERVYLIIYCFLLDQLIPRVRESTIKDDNFDSVSKLMKQIKTDISTNSLFMNLFSILEVLITIFYTMEFSNNISKLSLVKKYFSNIAMSELEIKVFNLENDLAEKLSKLTEISEQNNIDVIKRTVHIYQQELRKQISTYLRYFRFKVIEILFLLNDITS